jgi:hypothetical protein
LTSILQLMIRKLQDGECLVQAFAILAIDA